MTMRGLLGMLVIALVCACGGADPVMGARCEVGRTVACACPGMTTGVQECSPSGVYGACACAAPDAGQDVVVGLDVAVSDAPMDGAVDVAGTDTLQPADVAGESVADRPVADAVTDGGAPACHSEEGSAPLCPRVRVMHADPMRPAFRVTHLTITAPAALASPILGSVVNGALRSGGLLWGVIFDLEAGSLRTGAFNTTFTHGTVGQGLFDGRFAFYAANAPSAGGAVTRWDPAAAATTTTGDTITASPIMGTVRLPIFSSGALLTELPLVNPTITATLGSDRGCIGLGAVAGGRFDECTANWDTTSAGTITAVIAAADARTVRVESLMTTLCNLLAGSNCETTPMMMWTRQPDTMVGGMPGYTLTARFAAVAALPR